jgi:hypothetical protein
MSADTEDNTVDELLKERCALQAQIAELETALALSKLMAPNPSCTVRDKRR